VQKSCFPWYALVTVLLGAVLLAANADAVWSTSVDVAHHYALVFRLSEDWHLVPDDPSLGEMNFYPRGSHVAAAIVGMVVGSPFLGMQLVALGSLVLLWASCLLIVYAASGRTGPVNALVLAVLVVVNAGTFRVHGAEISGNYHYAQLVAQAMVLAVLAAAIRLDARGQRAAVYLLLLGALPAVTSVHLMPALELLGVLAGLALLDVVFATGAAGARLRPALAAGAAVVAGIATVVLHPAFAAMRTISANNGGVSLGPLGSLWGIGIICLIVLWLALRLLRAWQQDRGRVMDKYLALYGAALAGLCLLQMALRPFKLGSDYAVKKYAFGLASFLFICLALKLGTVFSRRLARKPGFDRLVDSPVCRVLVFGLTLAATVLGAARMRHELDTSDVVAIERQLMLLRDTALPAPPPGKSNLVVDTRDMPPVVNYMFSLAVARTPRPVAEHDFLGGTVLGPLGQYGVLVSSRGHSRFGRVDDCSKAASGPLLVLDAACVERAEIASASDPNHRYYKRGEWPGLIVRDEGLAAAEPWGVWSAGETVKYEFSVPFPGKFQLRLRAHAFATNAGKAFSVQVGQQVQRFTLAAEDEERVFELANPDGAKTLVFHVPAPVSPQQLGISDDARRLGMAITGLRIVPQE